MRRCILTIDRYSVSVTDMVLNSYDRTAVRISIDGIRLSTPGTRRNLRHRNASGSPLRPPERPPRPTAPPEKRPESGSSIDPWPRIARRAERDAPSRCNRNRRSLLWQSTVPRQWSVHGGRIPRRCPPGLSRRHSRNCSSFPREQRAGKNQSGSWCIS